MLCGGKCGPETGAVDTGRLGLAFAGSPTGGACISGVARPVAAAAAAAVAGGTAGAAEGAAGGTADGTVVGVATEECGGRIARALAFPNGGCLSLAAASAWRVAGCWPCHCSSLGLLVAVEALR